MKYIYIHVQSYIYSLFHWNTLFFSTFFGKYTDSVRRAVVLGMCVTAEDQATLNECQRRFWMIDVEKFAENGTKIIAPELLGLICVASVRHGGVSEIIDFIIPLLLSLYSQ